MKSLSFEFNQAAANRQFQWLLFLLAAWIILTDDDTRRDRKKRDRQRKNAARNKPQRKGPSP